MGQVILTFGGIEIEKHKFQRYKNPVFLEDVDIDNVLASNKISFGEKKCKYFVGYLHDNYKIKPLNIMLPKTKTYLKSYDTPAEWMHFLIEDDNL